NADINFRAHIHEFSVTVNQLFFYTHVKNPIELDENNFANINGYVDTKGTETNLRIGWRDLAFYLGYTFADVNEHINKQITWQPLTPKHELNADLTYEIQDKFRIGLEGYCTSKQLLTDGTIGKSYVTFGLLIQKMWK